MEYKDTTLKDVNLKEDNKRNIQQHKTRIHSHVHHKLWSQWRRPTEDKVLNKLDNERMDTYFGLTHKQFEQLTEDITMMMKYEGGYERSVEHIKKSGIDVDEFIKSIS